MDLVLVNLPGAGQFRAARKSMMINDDNLHAFEAEIHGLREAVGCTDIVQLYDVRTTETHFELELMKGGSVAQELAGAGTGESGYGSAGCAAGWGRKEERRTCMGWGWVCTLGLAAVDGVWWCSTGTWPSGFGGLL